MTSFPGCLGPFSQLANQFGIIHLALALPNFAVHWTLTVSGPTGVDSLGACGVCPGYERR